MSALRYGMIGGGFAAMFQHRGLAQVRGIDLVGYVSPDPVDHLIDFCRCHGMGEPRPFANIKQLAQNVDVLGIFAPNYVRLEIVEEIVDAVRAGAQLKGLICEKPLARNVAEARHMLRLIADLEIPTAYFENQVHMKPVQVARMQLGPVMEAMGPPSLVRSNEEHAGPHSAWFWDPTRQGGGVMCDMGCHCLAVGWYVLTPPGKPVRFLEPVSVSADLALLKWGRPQWRQDLLERHGVDYAATPAEDFATGMVTYRNPDDQSLVKSQFTVSWMFDKQGLRLMLDALGPGYALDFNTLRSPLEIFIGDAAAAGVADREAALEKLQASRGLLAAQPNEADLYGYTDENVDAVAAFREGRSALLDWEYGFEITRLTMAAYMAAERKATVDLTDPATLAELETFVPKIQQGQGAGVLGVS